MTEYATHTALKNSQAYRLVRTLRYFTAPTGSKQTGRTIAVSLMEYVETKAPSQAVLAIFDQLFVLLKNAIRAVVEQIDG